MPFGDASTANSRNDLSLLQIKKERKKRKSCEMVRRHEPGSDPRCSHIYNDPRDIAEENHTKLKPRCHARWDHPNKNSNQFPRLIPEPSWGWAHSDPERVTAGALPAAGAIYSMRLARKTYLSPAFFFLLNKHARLTLRNKGGT